MNGLLKAGIEGDRKMLADLAVPDAALQVSLPHGIGFLLFSLFS
mgnify:CR=1 FL=1